MTTASPVPLHIIVPLALLAVTLALALFSTLVYIPNNKVGIVEKLWAPRGGSLKSGLIAMAGEAGYQPDVLRGGWHFFVPLQYRIHKMPLVTVAQGKIGYVFARDGRDLEPNQALARNVEANDFEDARQFIHQGGQKGPQRKILREGTYAINLVQFVVLTDGRPFFHRVESKDDTVFGEMSKMISQRQGFDPLIIRGGDDAIGIVTVQEGPALAADEIIAPIVGADPKMADYHECFQDPEKFLAAGGMRGRQLQVLTEGTYYLNRLFATIEIIPKTVVDVGWVAVVVSYTGKHGEDTSGSEYKHGELVPVGCKGVWNEPLKPGKYAFNTYAGKVIGVPTTNFILKWSKGMTQEHKLDENLAEVALITRDAFEPSLPVSAVVHIDYRKAPLVIQRFGDIKRLVEQTLDPLVSAYFKNIGQTRTLIELLQDRSKIQDLASQQMAEKFATYSLELKEVLIGTPSSGDSNKQIETILTQLRQRQIADEQIETYGRQQKAADKERELREVQAKAQQQTALTESAIAVEVQGNRGRADLAQAQQRAAEIQALATARAEEIRIIGEGEAKRTRVVAAAEAERITKVGLAQALATEEQVRAYGGPKFQLTQQVMARLSEAIERSGVAIVPRVLISGADKEGAEGSGMSSPVGALLAMLLSDKMDQAEGTHAAAISPEAQEIKKSLLATAAAPQAQPAAPALAAPAPDPAAAPAPAPAAAPAPAPSTPAKRA